MTTTLLKKFSLLTITVITSATMVLPARAAEPLDYQPVFEIADPQRYLTERTAVLQEFLRALSDQNISTELFGREVERELGTSEQLWADATNWASHHSVKDFDKMMADNLDLIEVSGLLLAHDPLNTDLIRQEAIKVFRIYERVLLNAMAFDIKLVSRSLRSAETLSRLLRQSQIANMLFMASVTSAHLKGFHPFGEATESAMVASVAYTFLSVGIGALHRRFQTAHALEDFDEALVRLSIDNLKEAPIVNLRGTLKRWVDHSQLRCENIFEI